MNDSGPGRGELLPFKQPGFAPGPNDWPVYWPDIDPLNRTDPHMERDGRESPPLPERPFRNT
jgi:hypothetical protein